MRLLDGEPDPREDGHDAVRWLGPDELDEVDWLEPDRPFLAELAGLLARSGRVGAVRLILFDEDAAERAASRLRREGYDAQVRRERLAGEDDDEDHPWAVLSDAPELGARPARRRARRVARHRRGHRPGPAPPRRRSTSRPRPGA